MNLCDLTVAGVLAFGAWIGVVAGGTAIALLLILDYIEGLRQRRQSEIDALKEASRRREP